MEDCFFTMNSLFYKFDQINKSQHLSLKYCIPLVKGQSSFYKIRSLVIYIIIKVFNPLTTNVLSRRGPVNLLTPNFCNINLTETMTNLIVA